jgi:hypothetical protein
MRYRAIAEGLKALVEDSRIQAHIPLKKLHHMQEKYLISNRELYDDEEIHLIHYYLDAVSYKFHLANLSLEQLWSLSHIERDDLLIALQNSLDKLDVSDDELLLLSFVFEGFLLQARTFLNFYMIYLSIILRTGHEGSISYQKFMKSLENADTDRLLIKAQLVKEYFESRIFGSSDWEAFNPNNWGTILKSLRDKVAHRDKLRPSFDSDETLLDRVLFNWPTLQETTYDRFCQYMQNGMSAMISDISPIIYDLDWKPGPYRPELWE